MIYVEVFRKYTAAGHPVLVSGRSGESCPMRDSPTPPLGLSQQSGFYFRNYLESGSGFYPGRFYAAVVLGWHAARRARVRQMATGERSVPDERRFSSSARRRWPTSSPHAGVCRLSAEGYLT